MTSSATTQQAAPARLNLKSIILRFACAIVLAVLGTVLLNLSDG